MASLNYDFFNKTVQAVAVNDGYIEIRQAKLVLATSGKRIETGRSDSVQTKVAGTGWEVYYRYAVGADLAETILVPVLLSFPPY